MVRPNEQAPRSMEELCQPSIDGRGGPIAPIPIQATDFGLRHHMIQQVQNSQFYGLPGDDANRHIDKFLEITQHMKQNGVSDDALRLSLFPYSLTHHAIAWYDRLPRNSIHSFDDMMRKFLSNYFPPSMVTMLRNEITKFEQKPHESLFEAWEHYKLSIDRCPNHNMLLVTQIDTFYNGLTLSHRDTINVAAGATRDEMSRNISSTTTTESPEVVRQLEMMNKNFVEMMRQIQTVKTVDTKCETCGGPHSFTEYPAVDGYTQEVVYATTVGPLNELTSYMKSNEATLRAMQTQMTNMKTELRNEFKSTIDARTNKIENQNNQIMNILTNMQNQNSSGSGSLPSNTVANPRGDVKAITTRSGVAYDGPTIPPTPSPLPKEVERETEATKDKVQNTSLGSTAHVQPPVVQDPIPEPEVAPKPKPKPSIPYPSRLNDQKLREKANNQMLKFLQIFQRLHFDISFTDALLHMPKFASTFKSLLRTSRLRTRIPSRARLGVMAISVISVSSDSSEDSVGTPAERVILFETPIIAPTIPPSPNYTPASPDYSPAFDSEFDPSEDPSSDHIPPLPATSPFLSSNDDTTDSDTPDTPPSPTHGTPFTEITSSTQRSPVIPHSSSEASSDFHSVAYSDPSSRNSLPDHLHQIYRETSLRDDVIVGVSDEPHLEQDSDPEVQAEIDECFAYADALRDRGIDARVVVETIGQDETETGVRGPVEVRVERVTHPVMPEDIPEPAQEGAVEVTYETLGDLVQRFHDHTEAIPVHRIQTIEGVQREQGHRIVGVESAVIALTERLAELERDNRRLRGTMSVESQRVDRLQRGMSRMQRELRQIRRLRFYDRVRVGRLEKCARKHMGYRP
ncbi:reverse transcriptase domain-containing protein [Tanacetum coccineum]